MSAPAPAIVLAAKKHSPTVVLSQADDALLEALHDLHFLTAAQLTCLLYSRGSLTYVRAKLARLEKDGLIESSFLRRASRGGSTLRAYALAGPGRRYLRSTGRDVRPRLRRSEVRVYGYLHQAHTLAVSEFLLQARLFARQTPGVEIMRLVHERDMPRYGAMVQSSGRTVQVVPDGFLEFRVHERARQRSCPLVLELDRGSHGLASWSRKVEALAAWTRGAYQQVFGTQFLTIAVVVANDTWDQAALTRRQQQLQRWTEQVLTRRGEQHLGQLFLFGCLFSPEADPAALFAQPSFLSAFGVARVALIEKGVREG